MLANGLTLNDNKTGFVIIGTRQQLSEVSIHIIHVGDSTVTPVPIVRKAPSQNYSGISCGKVFFPQRVYNFRNVAGGLFS